MSLAVYLGAPPALRRLLLEAARAADIRKSLTTLVATWSRVPSDAPDSVTVASMPAALPHDPVLQAAARALEHVLRRTDAAVLHLYQGSGSVLQFWSAVQGTVQLRAALWAFLIGVQRRMEEAGAEAPAPGCALLDALYTARLEGRGMASRALGVVLEEAVTAWFHHAR